MPLEKLSKKITSKISHLIGFKKNQNSSEDLIASIIHQVKQLEPADSLKFLFHLEKAIYSLQGQQAILYGRGIHTKHKHTQYHKFFTDNIKEGELVLDIGCGNGALTFDLAQKTNHGLVYGIDLVAGNIDQAQKNFKRKNITYLWGDALKDLPDKKFDTIVMSNVLEHLEKRVEFLRQIKKNYQPKKIILRVPLFERDWRVPLQEELGLDYRLDQTHFIEYKQAEFWAEMQAAGLKPLITKIVWGEIWTVVK